VQTSTVPLDFTYLVTLARNYSRPGTFAMGDLNGDGVVDFNDFVILARNYGHSLSSGVNTTTAVALLPAFKRLPIAAERRPWWLLLSWRIVPHNVLPIHILLENDGR